MEAILELRGYKWFRKILILHQDIIDNQRRDFIKSVKREISLIGGSTTDTILDLEDEDVREKLIVVKTDTKEQTLARNQRIYGAEECTLDDRYAENAHQKEHIDKRR